MITVASVDYCERCRCKTLHVPTPTGDRICEWHVPTPAPVLVGSQAEADAALGAGAIRFPRAGGPVVLTPTEPEDRGQR